MRCLRSKCRYSPRRSRNRKKSARPSRDGLSTTAFPSGIRAISVEVCETVAPILMFFASTPLRRQMQAKHLVPGAATPLDTATFLAEMKHSIQRALAGPLTQ